MTQSPSDLFPVILRHRSRLAEAIDLLVLVREDGSALPTFTAGAHIDIEIQPGLIRQYSVCFLDEATKGYAIAVYDEPESRGGSRALHTLDIGARMRISTPRNHFPLDGDAPEILFLAGGIGITPILPMVDRLLEGTIPFELHFCARSPERAAFADRLAEARYGDHVHLHYTAGGQPRLDIAALLKRVSPATHIYCCGPSAFIQAVIEHATDAGFPSAQVHREFFQAGELEASADVDGFWIKIASTGEELFVPPDKSVIEVLTDAGKYIMVSCEEGVCGTCLTRVIEGIPEHRDFYLTPKERAANDQFTPCCSRAKTPRLTLDM